MGNFGVDQFPDADGGSGGGTGTTGGGSGGTGGGSNAMTGLPCDVANLVAARCASCHGNPTAGGAPVTLLSRDDFMRASAIDSTQSYGKRSVLRMQSTTSAMPPGAPPPTTEVDAFAAWVAAGMPAGSCGAVDAGDPTPVCATNSFYQPTYSFGELNGTRRMYPGLACISCHTGQNFQGQNPQGLDAFEFAYPYMGTVFTTPHDKDSCLTNAGAGTVSVEILDHTGTVILRMTPDPSTGNFFGGTAGTSAVPYTARVVTPQGTRVMGGEQTSGDCNTCHTVAGDNGAPGRIFLP